MKLKILFVIQKLQLRGAEIFACQLATELIAGGTTVDILYLFDGENALAERFSGLRFMPLQANQSARLFDFAAYKKLGKIVAEGDYDLVQANAGDTLKYTALSKKLYKWKNPLVYRNAGKISAFFKTQLHRWFNQWLYKEAKEFISVTEDSRKDLIGIYPAAATRAVTIPIGTYILDDIPVYSGTETERFKGEPVFINIASIVPEKNHAFLIDVFAEYFKKHHRGQLWIVGDGKLRAHIQQIIAQKKLQDRVILWGYKNNVISLLKASDVLVMTSFIEGLPGVILEALACRVPVITSNAGGIAEVIDTGTTGFCIEQFDTELYVKSINDLLASPELRSLFVSNGRQTIERSYLLPVIAGRFMEVYKKLLNYKA